MSLIDAHRVRKAYADGQGKRMVERISIAEGEVKVDKGMVRLFIISVFTVFFGLTQISLAQDTEGPKEEKTAEAKDNQVESAKKEKLVVLEDIIVTATRTEKEAATAPGSISVVTDKDIEKRNIQTVDQGLNTLPGVFLIRAKGVQDRNPQITLRGVPFGRGRTLVIMDNITLNDPMVGNLPGISGLAPEEIDRIEVAKGPFSSLYGNHAMGGVVNIITKMPGKREFIIKSGYGSSWERGEASDDLRRFYLSYGDKFKDKLSIFLSYGRKDTNGFPTVYNVQSAQPTAGISGWSSTTDTMGNTRYLIGDAGDNVYWDDNITLKAGYDFSKTSKIKFVYHKNRWGERWDDPHTYLEDAAGNPVWSYGTVGENSFLTWHDFRREQDAYNISYETEISTVKTKLSLSYVNATYGSGIPTSSSTRSGGPGAEWWHPSDNLFSSELVFTVPLFERHLLTFGGSFTRNRASNENSLRTDWQDEDTKTTLFQKSSGKDRAYSLFVQDEIMILDNLTAYIGFRQDWWETYDGYIFQLGVSDISYESRDKSSFSPKAAVVYKPFEKTTIRASAGKAFNAPTIVDLYMKWTGPTGITNEGNPDLEPETMTSWDIGAEQALWKGAKITATYFENYMKDLIYMALTTPTLYQYSNVGKAKCKGIELEVEQGIGNWLRLFANFTYTDSEVTENSAKPEIVGKNLTMVPEKMFNIGADLSKGPFSASIVGRYVSKIYKNDDNSDEVDGVYGSYDPYFVADAKVSYNITKFATLSFSVDNIFDEDYFYSDKAPGRSWFCELTLTY
ncbi:MAG: TonB-dependent receptor [Thermodesulfobacteriota bacterium]